MSGNGGMGGMPGVKKNKDMNKYKKGGRVDGGTPVEDARGGRNGLGRQRPAKYPKMDGTKKYRTGGGVNKPILNTPSDGGMARGLGASTKGGKFQGTF